MTVYMYIYIYVVLFQPSNRGHGIGYTSVVVLQSGLDLDWSPDSSPFTSGVGLDFWQWLGVGCQQTWYKFALCCELVRNSSLPVVRYTCDRCLRVNVRESRSIRAALLQQSDALMFRKYRYIVSISMCWVVSLPPIFIFVSWFHISILTIGNWQLTAVWLGKTRNSNG